MDGIGHLPPRRLRPRVGGRLAGGLVVPDLAPPVHPHSVVPAGGRHPLEEGEAAARAEEPVGRGVVPQLHTAGPGLPPQRLARLLPPRGGQEAAPRVRAAAAAGIRPGGTHEEDLGVPPLQGLAHSGPLGPELGAARENDGGDPDRLVLGPPTAVPPPVPGPRQEVLEAQDPGEQPHEGGQGAGRVGPAPPLGAAREHQGGLAVPPADQGEAVVPPLVFCEGGGGGGGGAACPRPSPRPRPRPRPLGPRAMSKTGWLQVERGPGPAAGGWGLGWGGGGPASPAPLAPWAGSARRPPALRAPVVPRGGGGGGPGHRPGHARR